MEIRRILVIGVSGAGKSTAAKLISEITEIPFVPTDQFYWGKDWQPVNNEQVTRLVDEATSVPSWVLDGNFDSQREMVWNRADMIVWLDYPLRVTTARVIRRNLAWVLSGETVWSGNRMTLSQALSGIRHSIRSHKAKRANYTAHLAELCDKIVVYVRCQADFNECLTMLRSNFQHA